MFVGHYGPSFVAKSLNSAIPLWVLFLAVQLVDILWAVFVLLGIEKVRIVPGITATNPLDLYYMPYTHSLVGSLLWAIAAALVCRILPGCKTWQAAGIMGAAVFSHWILDWLVHRPDLPLYDNTMKVGLGIWNYPVIAFALESATLFGGLFLYLRATKANSPGGRYGMVIFTFILLAMQLFIFFGSPPSSDKAAAVSALACYFLFAGIACWLERKRSASKL